MTDETLQQVETEVVDAGSKFIAEGRAYVDAALADIDRAAVHMGPAMVPVLNAVKGATAAAFRAVLEHVSGAIHGPAVVPPPAPSPAPPAAS